MVSLIIFPFRSDLADTKKKTKNTRNTNTNLYFFPFYAIRCTPRKHHIRAEYTYL